MIPASGALMRRQWVTLFEITNLSELQIVYRLIDIRSLPADEFYYKNANQLAKQIAYEIRAPVALVPSGEGHRLAIPADADPPRLEQQLIPHVIELVPQSRRHGLRLDQAAKAETAVALAFLRYHLRTPLMVDRSLWGGGARYFQKEPLGSPQGAEVDMYPGFSWGLVRDETGSIFLAVDTTVRYLDRCWLHERVRDKSLEKYAGRRCVYHYGDRWFEIQLQGPTGRSIADERFVESSGNTIDVYSYTRRECNSKTPWIAQLDPNSPAILFRYPGNQKQRHGALTLCKLTISTSHQWARRLHRRSILPPTERFALIERTVREHFQNARIDGQPIRISATPLEIAPRSFRIPALRFGGGRILATAPFSTREGAKVVASERYPAERIRAVLDPDVPAFTTTPFDPQYLILPDSLPRSIMDDVKSRMEQIMRDLSGRPEYQMRRILYSDGSAKTLRQQVEVVRRAVHDAGAKSGYGFLVLPDAARPGLHDYIKQDLHPELQLQCARATNIRSFYLIEDRSGTANPNPSRKGRLNSYLRNCSLGLMQVNRKWLWALETPLHYDVYVGIDVLNGMAGFTFVYNNAQKIQFYASPSTRTEQLSTAQTCAMVVEHLASELTVSDQRPRSIVFHRDGRTHPSELRGIEEALARLKDQGLFPRAVVWGVVDIRKTTATNVRIVERMTAAKVQNPWIGSAFILNDHEGLVSTTGRPFLLQGTANPLTAVIAHGDLEMELVLRDMFSLAQLAFMSPGMCSRLPITIKLTDDLLEPIASEVDREPGLYHLDEDIGHSEEESAGGAPNAVQRRSS